MITLEGFGKAMKAEKEARKTRENLARAKSRMIRAREAVEEADLAGDKTEELLDAQVAAEEAYYRLSGKI
jgi:hypothetical protein